MIHQKEITERQQKGHERVWRMRERSHREELLKDKGREPKNRRREVDERGGDMK